MTNQARYFLHGSRQEVAGCYFNFVLPKKLLDCHWKGSRSFKNSLCRIKRVLNIKNSTNLKFCTMVILMFHLRPASGILLSSVTWTNSLGRCSCSSLGEAMRSTPWLVSFLQRGGSSETVNNYSLQCNSIGSGYPGTYSKLVTNVNNESLTSGNVAVGGHPRQMVEIPWTPNSRGYPNHKL